MFISVGSIVATVIGLVVGIVFFDFGITEVFVVYLLTRGVFCILGLWWVREWLRIPDGWDRLREMLPFAAPFGVICVLSALLPFMERNMVQSILGSEELGLYAAGAKVGMLIALPINAFEIAWGPFSLSIFKEKDATASYRLILRCYSVLIFAMVLALTALGEPLLRVLGSMRYEGGGVVVFAVAMGLAVQALGSITSIGIVLSKKSYLKIYGYSVMIVVASIAIPLLARTFGFAGVAWGSLMANFAKTVLETWMAERVYPVAWGFTAPLALGTITLLVGVLYLATYEDMRMFNISLTPLLGIAVLLITTWSVILDSALRSRIMVLIRPKTLA
jgi:O-antigen/teichoic acid export membrane protein